MIDVPVTKGRKSFFKLYHLRPFIAGTVDVYFKAPSHIDEQPPTLTCVYLRVESD